MMKHTYFPFYTSDSQRSFTSFLDYVGGACWFCRAGRLFCSCGILKCLLSSSCGNMNVQSRARTQQVQDGSLLKVSWCSLHFLLLWNASRLLWDYSKTCVPLLYCSFSIFLAPCWTSYFLWNTRYHCTTTAPCLQMCTTTPCPSQGGLFFYDNI